MKRMQKVRKLLLKVAQRLQQPKLKHNQLKKQVLLHVAQPFYRHSCQKRPVLLLQLKQQPKYLQKPSARPVVQKVKVRLKPPSRRRKLHKPKDMVVAQQRLVLMQRTRVKNTSKVQRQG